TRRAFQNGKLGLSEAEAIGELLDAKSFEQIKLFGKDSRSRLSAALNGFYQRLSSLLSAMFAKIDYPDEDLAELSNQEMDDALSSLIADMKKLCSTYSTGRAIAEGIETVLLGKPNTGKSSLYNLLCGKDAAIVTDIAGTTRDVLENTVCLGRVMLKLSDTAGIRETNDPIEKIGVKKSKEAAEEAGLILCLFNGAEPLTEEDFVLCEYVMRLEGVKIALLTKSDLPEAADRAFLEKKFSHVVSVSAVRGDLGNLTDLINDLFTDGTITVGEDAIVSSARQHAALSKGISCVETALRSLRAGFPFDALASDLEMASIALSETDGRGVSEDVVAGIFSKFCVGK
ncbi:MAG: 50S ribosome-binding GTPase, partial [Clostridia bacterium]|nr:50S ribosome-binding GTPase [Clostridia bacterium]